MTLSAKLTNTTCGKKNSDSLTDTNLLKYAYSQKRKPGPATPNLRKCASHITHAAYDLGYVRKVLSPILQKGAKGS